LSVGRGEDSSLALRSSSFDLIFVFFCCRSLMPMGFVPTPAPPRPARSRFGTSENIPPAIRCFPDSVFSLTRSPKRKVFLLVFDFTEKNKKVTMVPGGPQRAFTRRIHRLMLVGVSFMGWKERLNRCGSKPRGKRKKALQQLGLPPGNPTPQKSRMLCDRFLGQSEKAGHCGSVGGGPVLSEMIVGSGFVRGSGSYKGRHDGCQGSRLFPLIPVASTRRMDLDRRMLAAHYASRLTQRKKKNRRGVIWAL